MADLSFTYADWSDNLSRDEEFDLTNYGYFNGGAYAPVAGGSGMTGVLTNSRWMLKMSALYQLPLGFDISGVFAMARGVPGKPVRQQLHGQEPDERGQKTGRRHACPASGP